VGLRRARHGDFEALTRSGVLQLVKGAADRARIKKRVHPHLFRHSFATEALRRRMNVIQLARILGPELLTW
jgi:site-specific recombinase XerD